MPYTPMMMGRGMPTGMSLPRSPMMGQAQMPGQMSASSLPMLMQAMQMDPKFAAMMKRPMGAPPIPGKGTSDPTNNYTGSTQAVA